MLLCMSSPPQFDLYILSNKSRQESFLAVSVKWISVNVNVRYDAIRYRFITVIDTV